MTIVATAVSAKSPLHMVMRAPCLNALVAYLGKTREEIDANPSRRYTLRFSEREITAVKEEFATQLLFGERKLHQLCELLAEELYDSPYHLQSVVIGAGAAGERFSLSQPLRPEALYRETDLALGTHLLSQIRFFESDEWHAPQLIANFVEYQPHSTSPHGIHKMISRIKAEEELWNKVVDELFGVDELVVGDKELRPLSRYIKDVFGVKVVVESPLEAKRLQFVLESLRFGEIGRRRRSIPLVGTHELAFLEIKDYLADHNKRSGWRAIKSVVRWWDSLFEVQIQPLSNYFREREYLTQESHAGFKQRREALRDQLAQRVPLLAFYRSLLKWLFSARRSRAPSMPNLSVIITD